jgi:hypothetical protein
MPRSPNSANRYSAIVEKIFFDHWKEGERKFEFARDEMEAWAAKLDIVLPKNVGDLLYSFRFRSALPESILNTQPEDLEWRIELAGRSRYRFVLGKKSRVIPRQDLIEIQIPDATPEIIRSYALDDEQALLAIVRYNRLIDIFLGLTTYSLQNHLRTTVKDIGQIEIDELYVGIDTRGCHYVMPIQAKGGKDQISIVQTTQDIQWVLEKFPGVRCRPISVQFMADNLIAIFELTVIADEIRVVEERHYRLVPYDKLDQNAIRNYT